MLPCMSIGNWFKKLFSSSASPAASAGMDGKVDINEARIDAGGSGIMGVAQHQSPGEDTAQYESRGE